MPYPPYYQPYPQPYTPSYPSQGNGPTFAFVNGLEGAKSYQIAPNQTAVLMDNENSAFYIKTANAIGQSTMQYFKAVACTEADIRGPVQTPYATKDEIGGILARLEALEKKGAE